MVKERFTRREFDQYVSFSPFVLNLSLPRYYETEQRFLKGDVVITSGSDCFLIKEELSRRGDPFVVRYQIPDFPDWAERVGFKKQPIFATRSVLDDIPLLDVPRQTEILCWDGTRKRNNRNGGIKVILIPGLFSSYGTNTFEYIEKDLDEIGFDEKDRLPASYRINPRTEFFGERYAKEDSLQDPLVSISNLNMLLHLWKKQFPLDRFVLMGHSQGGYLAYELAKLHPDSVAGFISLDGSLSGADVSPLPTPVEKVGARMLGGEAGRYYIERGADQTIARLVDLELKRLQSQDIFGITYSSIDDTVVAPRFSYSPSSNTIFGGNTLSLQFPMGEWDTWSIAKDIAEKVSCVDISCLETDLVFNEETSAKLSQEVRRYVGKHGAVLVHRTVREGIKTAFIHSFSNETVARKKREANLIKDILPHHTHLFSILYQRSSDKIVVVLDKTHPQDAEGQLQAFLQKNGVEGLYWLNNVSVVYD